MARIDDMPVYTDFNEGALKSLSFPINPLLLQSGEHILNLTLLPKSGSDFKLNTTLSEGYSVKIKIVRNENKKDIVVFEQEYKAGPNNKLPLREYIVPFNVDVPYKLSGWQNGIDLKQEDENTLEKEVIGFYNDMIKDYETKNLKNVGEKYYKRQLENAESLYLDQPQDSRKLVEELQEDLNKKQDFKLEHYKMEFYGNGKVVGLIRTDGEFRGKSAFLGLTDEGFYIYSLLLYRPKAGEPLQVIR